MAFAAIVPPDVRCLGPIPAEWSRLRSRSGRQRRSHTQGNRRTFHQTLLGATALGPRPRAQAQTRFEPNWSSLSAHKPAAWFGTARLGIFIHWGLYSVPAWAPPTGELGKVNWDEWFTKNPYAEWYLNTLRIQGSPT